MESHWSIVACCSWWSIERQVIPSRRSDGSFISCGQWSLYKICHPNRSSSSPRRAGSSQDYDHSGTNFATRWNLESKSSGLRKNPGRCRFRMPRVWRHIRWGQDLIFLAFLDPCWYGNRLLAVWAYRDQRRRIWKMSKKDSQMIYSRLSSQVQIIGISVLWMFRASSTVRRPCTILMT